MADGSDLFLFGDNFDAILEIMETEDNIDIVAKHPYIWIVTPLSKFSLVSKILFQYILAESFG